jgi:ubiquinone/menaquinone biosynthesis C-methylase UbiE
MTLPRSYFDRMYDDASDPWGFTDRWYEERKRVITVAALPDRRYATAYEPGCSIGMLTAALADRCDSLLASDVSERALDQARDRLSRHLHVRLQNLALPDEWPEGQFDLVVLSEVLYYLDDAALREASARAVGAIVKGGSLLTVHWRHPVADYPQSGDTVQEAIAAVAAPRLVRTVHHREDDFDLAVYVRPHVNEDSRRASVAGRAGLS